MHLYNVHITTLLYTQYLRHAQNPQLSTSQFYLDLQYVFKWEEGGNGELMKTKLLDRMFILNDSGTQHDCPNHF